MSVNKVRVLSISFDKLAHFKEDSFKVDFFAKDRVFDANELYKIADSIFLQNIICCIGLNATGKTTALRLLKNALDVIIFNIPLRLIVEDANGMIASGTIMRITFLYNGVYYQLESTVGRRSGNTIEKGAHFYYLEEILRSKNSKGIRSRSELMKFIEGKDNRNIHIEKRSELDEDIKKYLDDDKSFINPIIKGNDSYISDNLLLNYINVTTTSGYIPNEILEIFDESIESLIVGAETSVNNPYNWELKFKNQSQSYRATNPVALNFIISTGTIRGQELLLKAVETLKKGGYFIVDELEMHLNKEIVAVILSLFKSKKTNPYGACLIFSTHYPEILDKIDRKDNIYITRKKDHFLSVTKFSDEFRRNDFKKSEIILSNALTGTAPKYESIQRLREYICKQL